MSQMTELYYKHGVIKGVISYLRNNNEKIKRVEYLESIKDVNKAYIIANRYIRNYIHFEKKKDMNAFRYGLARLGEKWLKNGEKWLEEDSVVKIEPKTKGKKAECITSNIEITNESNEEFLRAITLSDNSIKRNNSEEDKKIEFVMSDENNGISLMKLAIENGVNKFNANFLDSIGIDKVLVGYKNDTALYYCKSVNGLFEVI